MKKLNLKISKICWIITSFLILIGYNSTAYSQVLGPIQTPSINSDYFVGSVTGFYSTIQNAITHSCTTSGGRVIIPITSTPSDTISSVINGCSTTIIIDRRVVPEVNYQWNGSAYTAVSSVVVPIFNSAANGLVPASSSNNTSDYYLGGNASWNLLSTQVIADISGKIIAPETINSTTINTEVLTATTSITTDNLTAAGTSLLGDGNVTVNSIGIITPSLATNSFIINGSQNIIGVQGTTGTKIQMASGSTATNDLLAYAIDGSAVDSGIAISSIPVLDGLTQVFTGSANSFGNTSGWQTLTSGSLYGGTGEVSNTSGQTWAINNVTGGAQFGKASLGGTTIIDPIAGVTGQNSSGTQTWRCRNDTGACSSASFQTPALTLSGLTSGNIPVAGTGGLLGNGPAASNLALLSADNVYLGSATYGNGSGPESFIDSTLMEGADASGAPTWICINATGQCSFPVIKVNGSQALTGITGTTGTSLAATLGTFTPGNLRSSDNNFNEIDAGIATNNIPLLNATLNTFPGNLTIGGELVVSSCSGCGGSGSTSPGGTTGSIQYNDSGVFGGVVINGLVMSNGTAPPTAATSTQVQTVIGSGVYDTAGSASSAQSAAIASSSSTSLQISNNLSDISSASTARTNLGLGSAATTSSSAYDVAGSATTAQSNAEAASDPLGSAATVQGLALLKANNLSDLASITTARTNLGLGTSSIVNIGTSGSTIPLLNAINTWSGIQTFTTPNLGAATATSVLATGALTGINIKSGENSVVFSTTPVFSIATQSNIITLTASLTSWTIPAGNPGQSMILTFCQNGTGNFTTGTPPSNVRGFFTVGIMASTCSSQSFTYSGNQSAWIATSLGYINE